MFRSRAIVKTGNYLLSKLAMIAALGLVVGSFTGCSSLGFSIWPAEFPLLAKTKAMAAASPLPAGMPHELSKLVLPSYFLEPGDRILIEPVDLESEIGSFGDQKIQADGTIDLGKFGRLRVAGMTVEAIEQLIETQIAASGEQELINVQLVETNAAEVYVIGEVGSPAAYPIDGHEHVLDAILTAGGLTSKASPCDIVLVRPTDPNGCRVVLPVCYRQITQLGDVTTNYQLQPGDRIVVGSRTFCEELAFWKQPKSCDQCCRSRGVECQPTKVQYNNRFAAGFPVYLPPIQPAMEAKTNGEQVEVTTQPTSDSYFLQPKTMKAGSGSADDDLFLPPAKIDNPSGGPDRQ